MNLVLTIAIGDVYGRIARLTHPSIKQYAKRVGADFKVITQQEMSQTTPHWEKFQIAKLLAQYERILYLDTDLIVRDDCPNLFAEVPENKLGMFNEARFTERSRELMIDTCRQYGVTLQSWDGSYYNSGVMVISKSHQYLFAKPDREIFNFYEQSYLNMMIAMYRTPMHDLHYKFNRMTCMDRFTGEDRAASYIIHYAGFPNLDVVLNLVKLDLKRWRASRGNYNHSRKHLYIAVTGGLGDQLCAEPAIRFMRTKLYPDDEMIVATHWPRIFKHLEKLGICVVAHGQAALHDDTPYYIAESLPNPSTLQWRIVSHLLSHTVDYASIALMKRTLPLLDKTIKFEVTLQDYADLSNHVDLQSLHEYIVVHPGKHWNSKTFPAEYWQAIIDGLVTRGRKVCVVGKTEPGDPPDFKAGARGTVDVECGDRVVDLREKLSIGALAALLSKAVMLITNDSAPVHLAGAFDGWIVLLPSCKHPDHVLPYRYGTQLYKTMALYKKLVLDIVESRPTHVYETSVAVDVDDWNEYLMNPDEVVEKVLSVL